MGKYATRAFGGKRPVEPLFFLRGGMIRHITINLGILGGALLYWVAVDYIYAKNYELYHPYESMVELSFLLFVLIACNYNYKSLGIPPGKARFSAALLIAGALSFFFLTIIYYFGVDMHIMVGYLLFPHYAAR
jgi:hypothetical protein